MNLIVHFSSFYVEYCYFILYGKDTNIAKCFFNIAYLVIENNPK